MVGAEYDGSPRFLSNNTRERQGASRWLFGWKLNSNTPAASALPLTSHNFQQEWPRANTIRFSRRCISSVGSTQFPLGERQLHTYPATEFTSVVQRLLHYSRTAANPVVQEPSSHRNNPSGGETISCRSPYRMIDSTTSPWTSVRRKSRPAWRYVRRVWSKPSRCRIVAWRSGIVTLFSAT